MPQDALAILIAFLVSLFGGAGSAPTPTPTPPVPPTVQAPPTASSPAPNSITIREANGAGQAFEFSSTQTGSFSIGDGASRAVSNVPAGSYTISQSALSGWQLTSAACSGAGAQSSANLAARTLTIQLQTGGSADCTFKNDRAQTAAPGTPTAPFGTASGFVYVAAGDSIPAGADVVASTDAYPVLLCNQLKAAHPTSCTNVAQSGATTGTVLSSQVGKIVSLQPNLVTLTVGADDVLGTILSAVPPFDCPTSSASNRNLQSILTSILQGTNATVVITTYYNPGDPLLSAFFRSVENCVLVGNGVIGDVIQGLSRTYPGRIELVDLHAPFVGHAYEDAIPWIAKCNGGYCSPFGGIHPNKTGQSEIASLIAATLNLP